MLFPSEDAYISWYELAGFTQIRKVYVAPDWYGDENSPYAIAIAGVKPSPGKSPAILSDAIEQVAEPMTLERFFLFWFRFVIGSATGALFVPIAAVRSLIAKFNPPQQDSQSK